MIRDALHRGLVERGVDHLAQTLLPRLECTVAAIDRLLELGWRQPLPQLEELPQRGQHVSEQLRAFRLCRETMQMLDALDDAGMQSGCALRLRSFRSDVLAKIGERRRALLELARVRARDSCAVVTTIDDA